jgi:hypothetical protein
MLCSASNDVQLHASRIHQISFVARCVSLDSDAKTWNDVCINCTVTLTSSLLCDAVLIKAMFKSYLPYCNPYHFFGMDCSIAEATVWAQCEIIAALCALVILCAFKNGPVQQSNKSQMK